MWIVSHFVYILCLVTDSHRIASSTIAELEAKLEKSEIRPTLSDDQLTHNAAKIQVRHALLLFSRLRSVHNL